MINFLLIIMIDFLADIRMILLSRIILIISLLIGRSFHFLLHLPNIPLMITIMIQPLIFLFLIQLLCMRRRLLNNLSDRLFEWINFIQFRLLNYLCWWAIDENHHVRWWGLRVISIAVIIALRWLVDVFALSLLLTATATQPSCQLALAHFINIVELKRANM